MVFVMGKYDEQLYTKHLLRDTPYLVGEYTYGKPIVHDWQDGATLLIGKYTSIAENVTILLGGNHRNDWISTYPFASIEDDIWTGTAKIKGKDRVSKGDVVIGNDVWIGMNTLILSGVRIHEGAVIAAGSVVTKDIPPYAIAGGNPARVIKKRFNEYEIDRLVELAWWNWPHEKVNKELGRICSSDVYGLIPRQTMKSKVLYVLKRFLPNPIIQMMMKLSGR